MERGDSTAQVKQEIAEAMTLGVKSTPTFIFGVRQESGFLKPFTMFSGSREFGDFKKVIDEMVVRTVSQ